MVIHIMARSFMVSGCKCIKKSMFLKTYSVGERNGEMLISTGLDVVSLKSPAPDDG